MKKIFILLIIGIACSPKTGFNAYFENEVMLADQAIDLPKWLPMLAIPQEAKEEIKLFTKGMKRVKLLRYERRITEGKERFSQFKKRMGMEDFLSYSEKGLKMNVVSKEEEGAYNEILITCDTDNEYYILALTGKMKIRDFQSAVAEVNKKRENKRHE